MLYFFRKDRIVSGGVWEFWDSQRDGRDFKTRRGSTLSLHHKHSVLWLARPSLPWYKPSEGPADINICVCHILHVIIKLISVISTPLLFHHQFKERDELVRIFKLWERPPSVPASVSKVWDARVRQHLGTRYDSRQGCFDWDLSMKLHQRGVCTKYQITSMYQVPDNIIIHMPPWKTNQSRAIRLNLLYVTQLFAK